MGDITVEKHARILRFQQIIYFILGTIEALLAFRFIFKLLGANPASSFVSFIYGVSDIFVAPFFNIFRAVVGRGIEVPSVLEPATVIAMLVYAFFTWGIIRLIDIFIVNHPGE